MIDLIAVFAIGIVVGVAIIQFVDLFLKIHEEDKRWKTIDKDWRKND